MRNNLNFTHWNQKNNHILLSKKVGELVFYIDWSLNTQKQDCHFLCIKYDALIKKGIFFIRYVSCLYIWRFQRVLRLNFTERDVRVFPLLARVSNYLRVIKRGAWARTSKLQHLFRPVFLRLTLVSYSVMRISR